MTGWENFFLAEVGASAALVGLVFVGISINPSPDYATVARAFDGYGEKVEEPGEVRAALQRGLKAIAGGQMALIDIRLAKAAETNERPDRAN